MTIKTANHLYELRKKNNLSQEEVAAKIGVSRQAVSKWERAESQPDTDNLIELAKLYNVSLDELVQLEELSDEELDSEKEIRTLEAKEDEEENVKRTGNLIPMLMILATIAFLLLGFLGGYWVWGWLTYLLALVINSVVEVIINKKARLFAYPVFVAMIYLFMGLAWPGIWHPTWVLFITIPVFYGLVEICDHPRKEKK